MGNVPIQILTDNGIRRWILVRQPVVEAVAKILGVERWRHAEDVIVGCIAVGTGQVVGIADYMLFGYSKGKALKGATVRVGAVVDGWIKNVADVVER